MPTGDTTLKKTTHVVQHPLRLWCVGSDYILSDFYILMYHYKLL